MGELETGISSILSVALTIVENRRQLTAQYDPVYGRTETPSVEVSIKNNKVDKAFTRSQYTRISARVR
jgi:hypothetical protein